MLQLDDWPHNGDSETGYRETANMDSSHPRFVLGTEIVIWGQAQARENRNTSIPQRALQQQTNDARLEWPSPIRSAIRAEPRYILQDTE